MSAVRTDKVIPCADCEGRGSVRSSNGKSRCAACNGAGARVQVGPSPRFCAGTGQAPDGSECMGCEACAFRCEAGCGAWIEPGCEGVNEGPLVCRECGGHFDRCDHLPGDEQSATIPR